MRKGFYMRFAAQNLQKNSKFYIPYLIASSLTASMFYIMCFLENNPGLEKHSAQKWMLHFGAIIIGIFAVILLLYINSFLMKRRQKEIGLYNVLGMEKQHICRIFGWETLYSYFITMACGFGVGILLSKLFLLLLCKLTNVTHALSFYISGKGMGITLLLFAGIFLLLLVLNQFKIHFSHPVELLRGGNVGEKEPKSNWFLAILGLGLTGTGYYIALTTTSAVAAIKSFFIAVLLVIVGTYFLFIAGTIVLLKLLRKNKKFYYKTNHFTAVSGLLYRMKQNATGLASICVLATMVIVMISSTVSLNMNVNKIINQTYPHDYSIDIQSTNPKFFQNFLKSLKEKNTNHTFKNEHTTRYLSIQANEKGNNLEVPNQMEQYFNCKTYLFFLSAEDYTASTGIRLSLQDNETAVFDFTKKNRLPDTFSILDSSFKQTAALKTSPFASNISPTVMENAHVIVVKNHQILNKLQKEFQEIFGKSGNYLSALSYSYSFDTDGTDAEKVSFLKTIQMELSKECKASAVNSNGYSISSRQDGEKGFRNTYGGMLFLGLFLSILFLMATVLIIYYKQISEGYDDAKRFQIMQKVGMSQTEVKKSIHSQVLIVFFLPLAVAVLHMIVAFPYMTKLLRAMYLTDIPLLTLCTVCTVAIFALVYVIVYALTTHTYYKIVSSAN